MADELLKALGRLQRAQQSEQAGDGPDGPLAPLDAEEQANILAAILGDSGATEAAGGPPPAAMVGEATVVPLARARARRGWLAGVASLAAAAALVVALRAGEGEPELPNYSITRASGEASTRGVEPASAATLRLRADTAIDWIVAPEAAAHGAVGLRLVASQGEQRRWIAVEGLQSVSADGVIRLRGRAGAALKLPAGPWTLTFVIARPERLPADLDAFVAGRESAVSRGWQLQQVEVQIEG